MNIEYLRTDCIETIKTNKFISAVEVEPLNGKGMVISKSRVIRILKLCEKIGYQQDDLLVTYDIYYEKCCEVRWVRVLAAK